ncbi:phosphatidate cytidylyltransferase [Nocardioides sp.]|uniref:phosphatidate cytidylyltransferase n=1 Tax=Nocardioides sp. TaxID=35761 RepID=UPI00321BC1B5
MTDARPETGPPDGPVHDHGSGPGADGAAAPQKDHGRAGRDLKAAITSGVVLLGAIAASLAFWKPAFMLIVVIAVVVAIWELRQGLLAKDIDLPEQPLMLGGAVMVVVAYLYGSDALVTATAVTALAVMLWLLRRGIDGYVKTATASVFTLVYVPFLGSFVALLLSEGGRDGGGLDNDGVQGILTFILVTIASDIGGYIAGVLFGKHPMAPVISPKKSWEGFAGSLVATVAMGWLLVVLLLEGDWWVGLCLGLIAVVMATLGDLCESVMKRDLGIKDMSQVIPGHGGLMDRLDSLLATIAPIWLLLHYLVFT